MPLSDLSFSALMLLIMGRSFGLQNVTTIFKMIIFLDHSNGFFFLLFTIRVSEPGAVE